LQKSPRAGLDIDQASYEMAHFQKHLVCMNIPAICILQFSETLKRKKKRYHQNEQSGTRTSKNSHRERGCLQRITPPYNLDFFRLQLRLHEI